MHRKSLFSSEGLDSWLIQKPIAHRGLHSGIDAPENSIVAFQRAVEENYPIELDVQLSLDNQLFVFHDEQLKRMTGLQGIIQEHDSSTLRTATLLGTTYHIPTFDEVLKLINGKVPLLVEIKNAANNRTLDELTLKCLSEYSGQFAIQSFNPFSVTWFRKNAPAIIRGMLVSDFKTAPLSYFEKAALRNLLFFKMCQPAFLSLDVSILNRLPAILARRIGIPIIAWTVRSRADEEKAKSGADNFIFEDMTP
ncbi:MAG TPA: glycerophosphodiester phosphodiesterase family protein [Candidatus Acidoferrales bacterium]|nr:glycerophosphodiester phosphodiesterase family protein [Candidatus Acidoferrales bacterium]